MTKTDTNIIDMDAVAAAVQAATGRTAYVEQTGGGTATIYVGPVNDHRFALVAGPGWFDGPGFTNPKASGADMCWGPDDDGESEPTYGTDIDTTATVAATLIMWLVTHA